MGNEYDVFNGFSPEQQFGEGVDMDSLMEELDDALEAEAEEEAAELMAEVCDMDLDEIEVSNFDSIEADDIFDEADFDDLEDEDYLDDDFDEDSIDDTPENNDDTAE